MFLLDERDLQGGHMSHAFAFEMRQSTPGTRPRKLGLDAYHLVHLGEDFIVVERPGGHVAAVSYEPNQVP